MRHFLRLFCCTLALGLAAGVASPDALADDAPQASLSAPVALLSESAEILKREADVRAARAAARPAAPAERLDVEDPFLYELEMFAADAMRLSRAVERAGGPQDLRCIFRGMSGDAEAWRSRIENADSAGAQARAYREVSDLMSDALAIAPAVLEDEVVEDAPAGCPAAG